jgi:DNA (cytosine-5)-methyltransferase 1
LIKKKVKKIRVLDLFSGAGGFSLGFCQAFKDDPNFEGIIGCELALDACRTYQMNLGPSGPHFGGKCQAICCDVRHLPLRPKKGYFTVIIGGPPCQPFSSLSRKRGKTHPLYDLVLWFLYWVTVFQPKVFVMEEVPAIMSDPFYGPLIKRLSEDPKKKVDLKKLMALPREPRGKRF